jgi:signal transduction histidine kinase
MDTHPNPEPQLTGRWLTLARIVWVLVSVASLLIFVIGTTNQVQNPLPTCANPGEECGPWVISQEDIQLGAGLGLSSQLLFLVATAGLWIPRLVLIALAALIFWRKSSDWVALLMSTVLMVGILEGVRDVGALAPLQSGLYSLSIALFALVPFVFPNGRFAPRWTLWVAPPLAVVFVLSQYAPQTIGLVALVWFILAAYAVIHRYRRIFNQTERQQTKWVMMGLLGSTIGFIPLAIISFIYPPALPTPERLIFLFLVYIPINIVTYIFMPASITVAIFRHRLWNIDILINRALVYGTLTAFVVAFYILVVGGLGALIQSSGNFFLSLLATGIIAVAFQPLRDRLQRLVNRLMYGERDDPYKVLSQLSQHLESTQTPGSILSTIVGTIAQTLKLPYAAILLTDGNTLHTAAVTGSPTKHLLTLKLTHQNQIIGELHIAQRSPDEPFTAAERRLLEDIASQTGVAVHNVRLTADLQRSREQIVSAREEERLRLRRDLHDGLGPKLAGQTLKLEAAMDALDSETETARTLLKESMTESQTLISEIRRLVYGLRPPALDQLGLLAAIREQATQYQFNGLQVTLSAPESLPNLPAAVEVAAYRIIQEALTNVARHSQARTCTVSLVIDKDLEIVISDDGIGLPPTRHAGVGLSSMRERAEEIGGACTIESTTNGTRVFARLPISNL